MFPLLNLNTRLRARLIVIYKRFGIDLLGFNGDSEWRPPLPVRIIIDMNGVVANVELTTDHTDWPEPEETVRLLKMMQQSTTRLGE